MHDKRHPVRLKKNVKKGRVFALLVNWCGNKWAAIVCDNRDHEIS